MRRRGDEQLERPCQRSRWSAELAATLVDDQTPIIAAPSDAYRSADGLAPVRNMKKATVAKNSGHRIASRPSKADRDIIFTWSTQPRPSSSPAEGAVIPGP